MSFSSWRLILKNFLNLLLSVYFKATVNFFKNFFFLLSNLRSLMINFFNKKIFGSNIKSLIVLGDFHNCKFFYYDILLRCLLVVGDLF